MKPKTVSIYNKTQAIQIDSNNQLKRKVSITESRIPREPSFVKLYIDDIMLLHNMPATASSLLHLLVRKLDYDGYISLNAASKRLFAEELGVSVSSINNQFYKMVKKDILRRKDTGLFMLNPMLFAKGSWIDVLALRESYFQLSITYSPDGKRTVQGKELAKEEE